MNFVIPNATLEDAQLLCTYADEPIWYENGILSVTVPQDAPPDSERHLFQFLKMMNLKLKKVAK